MKRKTLPFNLVKFFSIALILLSFLGTLFQSKADKVEKKQETAQLMRKSETK